jgi:hypothetical protein
MKLPHARTLPSTIRKGAKNPSDVTERPLGLNGWLYSFCSIQHTEDESRVVVDSRAVCFARTF